MKNQDLLAEVEDIIRTMPPRATIRHPELENFEWLGRVKSFVELWDIGKSSYLNTAVDDFQGRDASAAETAYKSIITLLFQAHQTLRMKTLGPLLYRNW